MEGFIQTEWPGFAPAFATESLINQPFSTSLPFINQHNDESTGDSATTPDFFEPEPSVMAVPEDVFVSGSEITTDYSGPQITGSAEIYALIEPLIAARKAVISDKIEPVINLLSDLTTANEVLRSALFRVTETDSSDANLARLIGASRQLNSALDEVIRLADGFLTLRERLNSDFITLALLALEPDGHVKHPDTYTSFDPISFQSLLVSDNLRFLTFGIETSITQAVLDDAASRTDMQVVVINAPSLVESSHVIQALTAISDRLGYSQSSKLAVVTINSMHEADFVVNGELLLKEIQQSISKAEVAYAVCESFNYRDDQAAGNFLHSALNQLASHIGDVDEMLVDERLRPLELRFEDAWKGLEECVSMLTEHPTNENVSDLDDDYFRVKFYEIAVAMDTAISLLAESATQNDGALTAAIRAMVVGLGERTASLIPSIKHIEGVASVYGLLGAYGYYEKRQRMVIWSCLRELQIVGNDTVQASKLALTIALQEAIGLTGRENTGPYDFLTTLGDGFAKSADLFVSTEIREYRDVVLCQQAIDAVLFKKLNHNTMEGELGSGATAASIQTALTENFNRSARFLQESLNEEPGVLQELLSLPNQMAYVCARRFRDNLLFSPNAYTCWVALLREYAVENVLSVDESITGLHNSLLDIKHLFDTVD